MMLSEREKVKSGEVGEGKRWDWRAWNWIGGELMEGRGGETRVWLGRFETCLKYIVLKE